jgi:membrane-bound lytic murein transglycosylase D
LQNLRIVCSLVGIATLLLASACSVAPTVPAQAPAPVQTSTKPPLTNSTAPKPTTAPIVVAPAAIRTPAPAPKDGVQQEPAVVVAPEDSISEAQAQIDLWERIRKGFAMQELDTPLVAEKEKFYTTKPEYLQRMFGRGGRYLFHIVEEVENVAFPPNWLCCHLSKAP